MKRFNYTKIKQEYIKNGKGKIRLTQSSLLLLQDINSNKSVYNFPVLENDLQGGQAKPKEIRLNQNDEFVVTELGIFLVARLGATPDVPPPVDNRPMLLFTNPPFNSVDDLTTMLPLWDGKLRIGVNNIIYLEKWDARRHLEFNQNELNGFVAGTDMAKLPSFQGKESGMYDLEPMITLSGAKKNELTIELPNAIPQGVSFNMVADNGDNVIITFTEIALQFRGFLGQNGAKFQN